MPILLPPPFAHWFTARGWTPHPHQLAMLEAAERGEHALLIAPTGGGKTLAGFLPSLIELARRPTPGLHTLYVSPLKALTIDIQRNLEQPIAEMGLAIRAETRTGDTPPGKRQRQRQRPPHLLLTTPESLALLLSYPDAAELFAGLRRVIVDELHALAGSKRGDLLALGLARLAALAPEARLVGLSATVAWPDAVRAWLSPRRRSGGRAGDQLSATARRPTCASSRPRAAPALARAHGAARAARGLSRRSARTGPRIVFVNTRAQAELVFQRPVAPQRGQPADRPASRQPRASSSGARSRRRWPRAGCAPWSPPPRSISASTGATSTWWSRSARPRGSAACCSGSAAPTTGSTSRAGRCWCRPTASRCWNARRRCEAVARRAALDGDPPRPGGLDVLAQHVSACACARPFDPDELYAEVRRAAPYASLPRADFDDVLGFVATGGYALAGLRALPAAGSGCDDGRLRAAAPAGRPAVPHERRHHRRGGDAAGAAEARPRAGRGRGVFRPGADAGRHLPVRRRAAALRGHPRDEVIVHARGRRRAEGAGLCRRPAAADDPPGRAGPRPCWPTAGAWQDLPEEVREWLRPAARRARSCRAGDELLVEAFRAAASSSSSPTASRAATRTRRWACC